MRPLFDEVASIHFGELPGEERASASFVLRHVRCLVPFLEKLSHSFALFDHATTTSIDQVNRRQVFIQKLRDSLSDKSGLSHAECARELSAIDGRISLLDDWKLVAARDIIIRAWDFRVGAAPISTGHSCVT